MLIKEMKRNEVSSSNKWDLAKIYKDDDAWCADYDEVIIAANNFLKHKGSILSDSNKLLKILDEYIYIMKTLSKLYVYAYMKSDEDISVSYYQRLKGKVDNLNKLVSESASFLIPELLQSNYDVIIDFYKDEPLLKKYKRMLDDIYRLKPFTLDETHEKLLSSMSNIFDNPNKTANIIRTSDLNFGEIEDENGNLIPLTNSNYNKYIESTSRKVREAAFNTMYKGYKSVANTLASTLTGEIEVNTTIAKIRGYNSSRHMSLFNNHIDEAIYDNLIFVVNENLDKIYKYYNLRKEHLNIDKITLYDIHVPIIQSIVKEYTFEEAREIVINALNILGKDYVNNLEKAFGEGWIDIYPNVGKKSGAYSWGAYGTPSYILLNYQNRLSDVSTLAHELGHSMHSTYSRNSNMYQDSQYKIFVAEVASITNELLLYNYLLENSKNKQEKLEIINYLLDLFKSTMFRQTMFAEFEKIIHDNAQNNEIITTDMLNKTYYELNKKYFGEQVYVNEMIKYEWARIPHFYTSFYVYQYATGLAAAVYLSKSIIDDIPGAREKYLHFLTTGGTDNPIQLLKNAGVDMTNPQVIQDAIDWFDELIEEFINLSK